MNSKITIISNNCWGAEAYIENNLPYNTPFVGLFVPPICFVKLCNNLISYLKQPLRFVNSTKYTIYNSLLAEKKYPIAVLNDVEIHFLHYKTKEEATEKWNRRQKRMDIDVNNWRVKGCDREIDDLSYYKELWNQIPYRKVFFSSKSYRDIDNGIFVSEFKACGEVTDGKALYEISKKYFDLEKFINSGEVTSLPQYGLFKAIKKIFL